MAEILKIYGSDIKISGPFHTIPLQWYSPDKPLYSSKLLRSITNTAAQKTLKRKSIFVTATICILILQGTLQTNIRNNATSSDSSLYFMLLFILLASNFYVYFCQSKPSYLAHYLNGLIQFDRMYPSKPQKLSTMSLQEIACVVMVKAALFSLIVVPIGIVFGFHWTNPWQASLAGYWLIPEIDNQDNPTLQNIFHLVCKLVVLSYNLWIWVFALTAPVFVVGLLHTLSTTVLLKDIET